MLIVSATLVKCYVQRTDSSVESESRSNIISILKSTATTAATAESSVRAWALLGSRTSMEDLSIVLGSLVDFLCHRNVLVRHAAVVAIHRLASVSDSSPWTMYSPYLRQISAQVIFRSQAHPHLLTTFSNLIGMVSSRSY